MMRAMVVRSPPPRHTLHNSVTDETTTKHLQKHEIKRGLEFAAGAPGDPHWRTGSIPCTKAILHVTMPPKWFYR